MSKKTLLVTGLGIKYLSHITLETQFNIKNADLVLYLLNEPLSEKWVVENSKQAESLFLLYCKHENRLDAYKAIENHIIEKLNEVDNIVVILYGHPTLCAKPALDAAIKAKRMDVETIITPGISSLACLFSDLMIDPIRYGFQVYEASAFINSEITINNQANLILLQVSNINIRTHDRNVSRDGLEQLKQKLENYYGDNQQCIIYEASLYPNVDFINKSIKLGRLQEADVSPLSTLYIAPKE